MPHPPVVTFPGIEALRRFARGALALAALERRVDRDRDARGDLVLHRENVSQITIVALGPKMPAGGGFDELRCHSHPVSGLAHAALEHITHAELAPDVSDCNRLALVGECRIAGDDEQ